MSSVITICRRSASAIRPGCIVVAVALGVLHACASTEHSLNSERIERTFGNYGVEILEQNGSRRVSSLYSESGGMRTTRTYAVVEYMGEPRREFADEHARIVDGASIGATFQDAGWVIDKQHVFIGELEVPATYTDIGNRMRLELPETLATHQYLFIVNRAERGFDYAMITEIHHPDYLTSEDLRETYGEILFDDSNRDSIHEFIGPPSMK